jgi:two-component system, OmpR family, response regulator
MAAEPGSGRGLVVVVEDEQPIADLLRLYLTREGFAVHWASDGRIALGDIRRLHPVAVIMDVGLPSMDGTEVCRSLRAEGNWTPVLFCTARDDEIDRVVGLELGGDDYITKPFSPREVVARVKVAVRRSRGEAATEPTLRVGDVALDRRTRTVTALDRPVSLTATEFDLLEHLLASPGRVFTREELLTQVWGYAALVNTRTVDVHVAQVRAKLGDASPIRTVRGVGYSAGSGR